MEEETKNYNILTKELILKRNRRSAGAETFVYEPSNIEEERLGNLYIIGWLRAPHPDLAFVPNLAASILRREFYKLDDDPVETKFENGLKKVNSALADIEQANRRLTAEDIGLCVINIAGGKMRFAQIGKAAAWLYRGSSTIDISHKNGGSSGKKEFFSSIVTGDICQGDKLIFSTDKIMDLFSGQGVKKLGALGQNKQAEIISGIYDKNSKETQLPDQAAILLEIGGLKAAALSLPLKKISAARPALEKTGGALKSKISSIARLRRQVRLRPTRKAMVLVALTPLLIAMGLAYSLIETKSSTLDRISARLAEAEKMSENDKDLALSILREAQASAVRLSSDWYLYSPAEKLLATIDREIGALNGIYHQKPAKWARLNIKPIKFSPMHIFDGGDSIYVFGQAADFVYRIEKQTRRGSFMLLRADDNFPVERMLEKDGDFYMISDSQKSAYVFYPAAGETVKVVKTLVKILNTPSRQNEKRTNKATYQLDGGNKIVKNEQDNNKKKLLLGEPGGQITDFSPSGDGNIYLLTAESVMTISDQ